MALRLAALYRHPVKGLSAEPLPAASLAVGACLPGDRRFALARAAPPDGAPSAGWQPKTAFFALHNRPALAALDCRVDAAGRIVLSAPGQASVCGDPQIPAQRMALEDYLAACLNLPTEERPHLLQAAGCAFTDARQALISIVSQASLADLERSVGEALDMRRFRANLVVGGGLPWQELDWIGAEIGCGAARLRVLEPILRCAAIQAEPGSGRCGPDLLRPLARRHGEAIFGVYAEVVAGGEIAPGDAVVAPPGGRFPVRDCLGLR